MPLPPPSALPPTIPACDPHDGPASLQLIEDLTTHAGAIQRRVLREILAENAGADYVRHFLGADAASRGADELAAAFKSRVPVVEYEDVKPYIERIASGAPSSLSSLSFRLSPPPFFYYLPCCPSAPAGARYATAGHGLRQIPPRYN